MKVGTLRDVNWRRIAWIAVFAWLMFNQGWFANSQKCDPMHPSTCEVW